jgi:hypothetical protein
MSKIIYANKEHQIVIEQYIVMLKEFVRDVSNNTRWNNYKEIIEIVIEYHNNYGNSAREDNYWDWLMILPINLSVMTNGFLAGIETKGNKTVVHSYKLLLNEMLQDVVSKLEKIEPVNE